VRSVKEYTGMRRRVVTHSVDGRSKGVKSNWKG